MRQPTNRRSALLLDHSLTKKPPRRFRLPRWPRRQGGSRTGRRAGVAVGALMILGVGGWLGSAAWFGRESSARLTLGIVGLGVNAPLGGEILFPPDNAWNTEITDAPVHPLSQAYLASIGFGTPLHPDFGSNRVGTVRYGIPYVVVDGSTTATFRVPFEYAAESDPGPYPIPPNPPVESGGDRHVLILDREAWRLYELYLYREEGGGITAGSGAIFDLRSNVSRPRGWTSADAAGLPILPGLVRADEVYDLGEIRHALRFTARRTQRAFVYPARHHASRDTSAALPPMGLRLRLKADADVSGLPEGAHVIATALQRYGMILADNGGPLFLTGTADGRWKRRDTEALKRFTAADFEVIVPPPPPASDTVIIEGGADRQ